MLDSVEILKGSRIRMENKLPNDSSSRKVSKNMELGFLGPSTEITMSQRYNRSMLKKHLSSIHGGVAKGEN